MEDLFDKNFKKAAEQFNPMADEDSNDDEDDKQVIKAKNSNEYANRYYDYEQQPDLIKRTSENFNINRQSISMRFLHRKTQNDISKSQIGGIEESKVQVEVGMSQVLAESQLDQPQIIKKPAVDVKEDEVTDIIDDNDIISPLQHSLIKENKQQLGNSITNVIESKPVQRPVWGAGKNEPIKQSPKA